MEVEIGKKFSAWSPVIMSIGALALCGVRLAMHGTRPVGDEDTLVHLWQFLVLGQAPVIGFFAFRWLRADRRQGAAVLVTQLLAAGSALVPVLMMAW